ncbi:MAG: EamA family transporter [Fibrobacteres bacterium]|nr:EamA family transporter [Fibrobacterota bacterium]
MPIIMLLGTAFFWSLGGLLIKSVDWHPMAIAGGRSLIAVLFLIAVTGIPRIKWSKPLVLGAIAYSTTVILFVIGNKLTTAANVILLQYTSPVYVALMSRAFLGERITRSDWYTIILVMCGMVLFFLDDLTTGNMIGNLCGIVSGVTFGTLILCLRKQKDEKPETSIILGNLLTALVGIPFMFSGLPDAKGIGAIIALGVLQLGVSYLLYSKAIRHVTALQGILVPVLEPLLNPIWVLIFIGEKPGKWAFFGGIIIIGAVVNRYIRQIKNT